MTLTQLRTFALVARLGSLRAAAAELGVSEPAVSAALGALRTDLGDPLFVRAGGGRRAAPGGSRGGGARRGARGAGRRAPPRGGVRDVDDDGRPAPGAGQR